MIAKDRPENNIFALAYLILLILGALFGGLVVFGLVIPEVRELGADVGGAAMVIAGLGVMSLLVAAAAAFAAQGMWRGRESGRVATLLLAVIMALRRPGQHSHPAAGQHQRHRPERPPGYGRRPGPGQRGRAPCAAAIRLIAQEEVRLLRKA
jgi:hypothetical protein